MTKIELQKRLQEEHIRNDAYCLDGGLPNEAFCLNKNGKQWEVYYSERGGKSGLKIFNSEEEACSYFYNLLVKTLKNMKL